MLNPFTYLRQAARQAVLGGIQDALAEAAPPDGVLTVTVTPALPAATEPAQDDEPSPVKTKRGAK